MSDDRSEDGPASAPDAAPDAAHGAAHELPPQATRTGEDRLPGDPDAAGLVERMIRVDHAGEYGAARIYEGQLAILGERPVGATIREMRDQETRHLEEFDRLIVERRVRPTALSPIWHAAGYALGVVSALAGERAAMATTVAVEEVIEDHYARQARQLGDDEAELRATVTRFREDESEHKHTGLAHEAEAAPGYPLLSRAVKKGTRLAIWFSERL